MSEEGPTPVEGQALIYATADGTVRVEVLFGDETFWLTQKRIAELFGVDVRTVNEHLKNIFLSGELAEAAVVRKSRITAADGKAYLTNLYNLDAVISVGYRVNSRLATQFRIWATQTLKEFIVKGFVLDDERLKQGARFGKDYFDELLERIREIRASERRFYLKITDIYEQCSIDYDKDAEITQHVLRHRAEQAALGHQRHDGRRDRRGAGGRRKTAHGSDHLEEGARRQDPEVRRLGRQELPGRGRGQGLGTPRSQSGSRRASSRSSASRRTVTTRVTSSAKPGASRTTRSIRPTRPKTVDHSLRIVPPARERRVLPRHPRLDLAAAWLRGRGVKVL